MSLRTHMNFQKMIFKQMDFSETPLGPGSLWQNSAHPENGCCFVFHRTDAYVLTIGDYKIPKTFQLSFLNSGPILRFGSLYEGKTRFHVEGIQTRSSSPVNFIVKEENIQGVQYWQAGAHYKGVEIALSFDYVNAMKSLEPHTELLGRLPKNVTQNLLPSPVSAILSQLSSFQKLKTLTPLILEGMILQCLGFLSQAAARGYFSPAGEQPAIYIGKKKLTFTQQDFQAIEQVRQMILENPGADMTIAYLGHKVFLNEQKLKTGFNLCYHTTIGAFIRDCRMSLASELLIHTGAAIEEIAQTCGYGSSTGFIRAFRQKYQMTPLRFRQEKRSGA